MSKTLSTLISSIDLRSTVATKLGCDVANIPEANVTDLAKTLQLTPVASVVEYTTKAGKLGAYLSCDDVVPAGRFGGGGKLFARLGEPADEVTEETISKLRQIADAFADRSQAIHELVDAAETEANDE